MNTAGSNPLPNPPPEYRRRGLVLTREQVRRIDQIAIEDFGVPGIVLMENAARGAVQAIYDEKLSHQNVLILCGGGNNGGDGLTIGRHLHNGGSRVTIGLCTDPAKYQGDALINWNIVQAMKLDLAEATPEWLDGRLLSRALPDRPTLLIDAIFGTGLTASPRDPFPAIAAIVHQSQIPVVAIDLPSGLDCDTGQPLGRAAIRAGLTVTFVGIKQGFTRPGADAYTGRIKVVDIGCPVAAVHRAMHGGQDSTPFPEQK
ncbi:NAD(P)H-hydrate epimerase [Humisphaera borealis]|uniref:NAD(P)H-hydrate epimerase n=1 Tax=Humisphaera borealis TaxID=2807512 RepID=A0A7M2WUM4_9BACT|nr:NAD(P)H-hydrate epimerase [Humisphaera borealis]QOV88984.1 NAD(P)H-hydrate epimerase [Humisphaera borealis]